MWRLWERRGHRLGWFAQSLSGLSTDGGRLNRRGASGLSGRTRDRRCREGHFGDGFVREQEHLSNLKSFIGQGIEFNQGFWKDASEASDTLEGLACFDGMAGRRHAEFLSGLDGQGLQAVHELESGDVDPVLTGDAIQSVSGLHDVAGEGRSGRVQGKPGKEGAEVHTSL